MGDLVIPPSWQVIFAVSMMYLAGMIFYRLKLHPLARFPGPKLAAVTRGYEAYYDFVLNGKYTFKIKELHMKYGPIIRISPHELHIHDHDFLNALYNHDSMKKYAWSYDAHTAKGSTAFTIDHQLHKARRQPLNPFFSKAKVNAHQNMIQMYADKLCRRISEYTNTTFDLGAASLAFTQDVANEFIMKKTYGSLDREDFDVATLVVLQGAGKVWRLNKHLRWYGHLLKVLPLSLLSRIAGDTLTTFLLRLHEQYQDTESQVKLATSPTMKGKKMTPRTIVNDILDSKLQPSDKTAQRIYEDVSTICNAAFETTANVLRLILFHVYSNPVILQQLRAELKSIRTSDLKTLEQLPYLAAVLKEGLRLGGGLSTRLQRISEKDLFYGEWRIPAGHPVGMTPFLLHTDDQVHCNAHDFIPARWIDVNRRKQSEAAFVPFSKGSRICLGMHLAWAELYIVVAALVRRFDFAFPSATAQDFVCDSDQFLIQTRAKGHLYAIPTPTKPGLS
ncbi:trichodiene oxygenase [Xylaria bambusicola]|uniref:trichodiene oxygenase n=1 Tax=Xylaria bambusicola TaxID=326684 RepID=UPI0020073227|nr:trichodiene oxygenase [Xylaria bambusicola]KAI0503214.1 trichodiene oxygenase [Xylaria bambusicola]